MSDTARTLARRNGPVYYTAITSVSKNGSPPAASNQGSHGEVPMAPLATIKSGERVPLHTSPSDTLTQPVKKNRTISTRPINAATVETSARARGHRRPTSISVTGIAENARPA